MSKRKYRQTLRAEKRDETRHKIVEALVALHEEVGPANTSVKAVAEKAGVQRLTVYRHFPDEAAMFQACSAHFLELNPPPAIIQWQELDDSLARCVKALTAFYKYYRQTEKMWVGAYQDVDRLEALQEPMSQFEEYLDMVCDDLLKTWNVKGSTKKQLSITLRHALSFLTWKSLKKENLKDDKIVELVVSWIACTGK